MPDLYRLKVIGEGVAIRFNTLKLAELTGLESFDYALPQRWVDRVKEITGRSPVGHFVWGYDWNTDEFDAFGGLHGVPVALDEHGAVTLQLLERSKDVQV